MVMKLLAQLYNHALLLLLPRIDITTNGDLQEEVWQLKVFSQMVRKTWYADSSW